jgi:hypothetical protein
MSEISPFVRAKEVYQRRMDFLGAYVRDQAQHLVTMTGKPFDYCENYVREQLRKGGHFEFKDPPMQFMERGPNGDRELKNGTLYKYISATIAEQDLIAPTLTTYINAAKDPSIISEFIDVNVDKRKKAKKLMFAAQRAGDVEKESIYNNEQNNKKISNNSISGGHLSASTVLFNPTGHSTLTSNCRATSGFGNTNNEKLLSGNRHYWCAEIVRNNIISVISNTDMGEIERAMQKYNMVYPSVEDVMSCIGYSTDLYWRDRQATAKLKELVDRLTPVQRAAFVYVGDMYQMAKLNNEMMRDLIGTMAQHPEEPHPDQEKMLKGATGTMMEAAVQICEEEMRGKDSSKMEGTREMGIVAQAIANMQSAIDKYADLIRAFLRTDNVPASLGWLPNMVRRSALTSDTDSTIFTVQDWVEWYFGEIRVDPRANAVAAVMVYFSSETIVHILAMMSANFGVEPKKLFQIAMKNEYKFDVFVPTQVAKHYFALMGAQEGNLFAKYKNEIKGVHLKSSNAPRKIIKAAEDLMLDIMNTIKDGKKIKIIPILKMVADYEREIFNEISSGGINYFRRGQIKPPDSYTKNEMESPFSQYILWNEVFGPDYGEVPPPPYTCVKITTTVDTPSKTREWLDSIENRHLATRMQAWLTKYNKKYLGTIQVPEQIVASRGIPKEILDIAGARKIVRDTTSVFYIILEALNFFYLDDRNSRLLMDLY